MYDSLCEVPLEGVRYPSFWFPAPSFEAGSQSRKNIAGSHSGTIFSPLRVSILSSTAAAPVYVPTAMDKGLFPQGTVL